MLPWEAPMVKPILQTYPVIHAENEAEREKLRPIGRNRNAIRRRSRAGMK
jgi:hypothetical protein